MLTEKEPSQAEFNSIEQTVLDVFSQRCPNLVAKAGSVVHELIVRPLTYMYAWASGSLDKHIEESSVSYLSKSSRTENEVADLVASNYFIERRTGRRANGMVTILVNTAYVHIPAGSVFVVNDVILKTEKRIIAMDLNYRQDGSTTYVPRFPYDDNGTYIVNIPVVADAEGKIELAAGTDATPSFGSSFITKAWLSSAVTGGQDTETDSEMMERARYSTAASGVGTVYGIRKLLDNSPIQITGLNVLGRDNPLVTRAVGAGTDSVIGGYIDCYIKTQDQASIGSITAPLEFDSDSSKHIVSISPLPGLISVTGVRIAGIGAVKYTATYSQNEGMRLSAYATVTIAVELDAQADTEVTASVDYMYMPGIAEVESFINSVENRFVGLDLMAKAAIPVTVSLDCVLKTSNEDDEYISKIKETISRHVCSLPVGTEVLNFSDIQAVVNNAYPDVELRIPCVMSASMPDPAGNINSFYSNTGLLNIREHVRHVYWDPAVCFFSLITSMIRIEVV